MTCRGWPRRQQLAALVPVLMSLCVVAACGGRPPHGTEPGPSGVPATVEGIDLSRWKLSIPEENDDGKPTLVEPARVRAPWMTANPGGGVVFWAPASGPTTENSEHPRTELNSLTQFRAGRGVHTLRASVSVLQVPRDGRGIILGQIHGAGDIISVPYVMLRYQGQQVKVVVKTEQEGDQRAVYPLLDNVPLGGRFDFTLADLGTGTMELSGTIDGRTVRVPAPVPAAFLDATVRFQAGDYQQSDEPAGSDDGGRVIFHRLAESTDPP